jgi:hypothetical protein
MQTGMHDQLDCTNYEGKIFKSCKELLSNAAEGEFPSFPFPPGPE